MAVLWELWSFLVDIARYFAAAIAVLQAMVCGFIFLVGSIFVIYIGHAMENWTESPYMKIVDFILGVSLSDTIKDISGFFKVTVIVILLAIFIITILLCKGLCEKKPWYIMVYVIIGALAFGFRLSLLTQQTFEDSYDKACRSLEYFGLFLLTLFVIFVQLLVEQRQQNKGVVINEF